MENPNLDWMMVGAPPIEGNPHIPSSILIRITIAIRTTFEWITGKQETEALALIDPPKIKLT